MDGSGQSITQWLRELPARQEGAWEEVAPALYAELRLLAHARLRHERPGHTLSTTGLVHEAYLKLSQQLNLDVNSRAEFFAFASECMRRVLVDYARARQAVKRGGGAVPATFDDAILITDAQAKEVTEIDLALNELEQRLPRCALVLQCRLFGGLTLDETASALAVSAKTVQRDWTAAIAWLRSEVGPEQTSFEVDL